MNTEKTLILFNIQYFFSQYFEDIKESIKRTKDNPYIYDYLINYLYNLFTIHFYYLFKDLKITIKLKLQ